MWHMIIGILALIVLFMLWRKKTKNKSKTVVQSKIDDVEYESELFDLEVSLKNHEVKLDEKRSELAEAKDNKINEPEDE